MPADQRYIYGDLVQLNIPEGELTGRVTGIIYRRNYVEYEILWNDGQTLYHEETELKPYQGAFTPLSR